jgi:hypothetical protein
MLRRAANGASRPAQSPTAAPCGVRTCCAKSARRPPSSTRCCAAKRRTHRHQSLDIETARRGLRAVSHRHGRRRCLRESTVAGTTGSAETMATPCRTLFVCFAPYKSPQIAIAVIVENSATVRTRPAWSLTHFVREVLSAGCQPPLSSALSNFPSRILDARHLLLSLIYAIEPSCMKTHIGMYEIDSTRYTYRVLIQRKL